MSVQLAISAGRSGNRALSPSVVWASHKHFAFTATNANYANYAKYAKCGTWSSIG
ncbi:MAG: hypothetical protein QNL49_02600 [Actinomycetota bacterium]